MRDVIVSSLVKATGLPHGEIDNLVEVPKDPILGDFAFPCFALARHFKKNPVEIAKDVGAKIEVGGKIGKVNVVGPYVNFFLNQEKIAGNVISDILKQKEKYGSNAKGKGKTFMMEFSQPNTHKAFHVGHIRGTSFGESLARIREFSGYNVVRANYSGDTGMHIAKWMWAYTKFHKKEKIRVDESWFAKIYVEAVSKLTDNEKGQKEVEEINRKLDARGDKELMKFWKATRKASIAAWKPIYKDLDTTFDVHFFESQAEEPGKKIAHELVKKNIARISEEATIMDLKDCGLGVWVLLRKDGTVLYSAKDLALAQIKLAKYKIDESLIITSVEQNLHFQQLRKTLELMKFPRWKEYLHMGYESVRFPWGKMSSRTGDNVYYASFRDELMKEAAREIAARGKLSAKELDKRARAIAVAAMKYSMLKQDANKILIFNKEEALRFEGDTGPYLLYSYARARSILRKKKIGKSFDTGSIGESERLLMNELARFGEVVQGADENFAPAMIAHYAYKLAHQFNEFYHAEKVIGSEHEAFRLALVAAFAQVLKNALSLLGIPALEEM
jgi:arginyl-tRNA synthetase